MKRKSLLLAMVLSLIGLMSAFAQPLNGAYTIDPLGSGGSNFISFSTAVSALTTNGVSGPVTFTVANGTYVEQVNIGAITGASSTNTITFRGSSKTGAILSCNTATTALRHTLRLNGSSWVVVRDLTIRASTSTVGWPVHIMGSTNNCRVANCNIDFGSTPLSSQTNDNYAGIVMNNSTTSLTTAGTFNNIDIDSNFILGGQHSLWAAGTAANSIVIRVRNNNVDSANRHGLYFSGIGELKCLNNLVENRFASSGVGDGTGIFLQSCNAVSGRFHEIRSNRIINTESTGIHISSTTHASTTPRSVIANNAIGGGFRGTNPMGIYLNSNFSSINNTWDVFFNTVLIDNVASSTTAGAMVVLSCCSNQADIRNNQFIVSNPSSTAIPCRANSYGFGNSVSTLNFNNYFKAGQNAGTVLVDNVGTAYTVSNFVGGGGYNANSISRNPLFPSAYNLISSTPCNNGQAITGYTTDINGATRAAVPDIGAYEYQATANDAGITAIVSPVAPFNAGSQNIVLTLSNFGSTNLTSVNISYNVNGGTPVTKTWTGSLAQCATTNYTFSGADAFNFAASTTYTIKGFTSSPNSSSDGNTINDTATVAGIGTAMSGNYTIDMGSPASATNFQSFTAAATALNSGGVSGPVNITVIGTTPYVEQVTFNAIPGASATNTITIDGGTGNAANRILSFDFPVTPSNFAVMRLNGTDYLRVKNLTIRSTSPNWGYGVLFSNQADYNIIDSCIIDLSAITSTNQNNSAGICFSGASNNTTTPGLNGVFNIIRNNEIKGDASGGPYRGISIYGSTSGFTGNNNNEFRNNTITDFFAEGIYMYYYLNNTIVSGNSISRPNRTSSTTVRGIYMYQYMQNTIIDGNKIFNPFGGQLTSGNGFYGIEMWYCFNTGNNTIRNNAIYNINGNGQHYGIYSYYNYGGTNYYNNTISFDFATAKTNTNLDHGINIYMGSNGTHDIRNNIITLRRAGSSTAAQRYGIFFQDFYTGTVSNNNLILVNAPTASNFAVRFNNVDYPTLAAWKVSNNNAFDQASVSLDPIYANVVTNVTPTSCGINNLGAPIASVNTDINGVTRGSTPDIGAYEFSGPSGADATVSSFVNPGAIVCPGSQPIVVRLRNAGTVNLTSATIGWDVNGTPQSPFSWTGSLAPNAEADVTVGTFNIPASTNTFRAFTSSPNGTSDVCAANDTTVVGPVGTGMSGVYTINPSGSGSTNFTTFNAAVNALRAQGVCGNVTFNVAAATYNEKVTIPAIQGASANSRVIFDGGTGNAATRILQFTNSGDYTGIHLNGADFITIKNLTIRPNTGITSNVLAVLLRNNADNNIIDSNIIDLSGLTAATGTANVGIAFSSSVTSSTGGGQHGKDNIIRGNQILGSATGGAYRGISIYNNTSANYAGLSGNRVIGNTITNFYESGIYIYYVQNTIVTDNNISRPLRTTSTTIYGIYGYYDDNNIYERNRIHNPFGGAPTSTSTFYGIYSYSGYTLSNVRYANNLIYNVNGNGSHWGIYVWYHYTPTIMYNTISFDNTASTSTGTTRAIEVYYAYQSTAQPAVVRNNIISLTRGGSGTKHGLYLNQYYFQSNNNVVYTLGTNTNFGYFSGPSGTATFATLATWQATTTQDANSSNANPNFTNPAAGNFQPTNTAMNNTGFATPLVTTDINSMPRNVSTPDPGAYEWGTACSGTPSVSGVTIQGGGNALCGGETVTLVAQYDVRNGLTFQWQSSPNGSVWTNVSGATSFSFVTPPVTGLVYYRCAVTCGASTAFTAPAMLTTGLNGVYTINPAGSGSTNFTSFTSAVAAMTNFGVCGPVTFNVAAATYTERVLMGVIPGASSTNRITFNGGNGNATSRVIQFAATATELPIVSLNGTDFVTFKNLTIRTTATNAGYGFLFRNSADNNVIDSCIIDFGAVTTNTTNAIGIVFSGSDQNYSTLGNHGNFNTISNNLITGSATGSAYFGISLYGEGTSAPTGNRNNSFINNEIRDFGYYGMYLYYGNLNTVVSGNRIYRPTRNLSTTIYGIYCYLYPLNFTIENNRIYSPYGATGTGGTFYGIYLGAIYNNAGVVRNNLIYNANGASGTVYGIYGDYISNTRVYHNTIAFNDAAAANVTHYGLYLQNGYTSGTYDQDIKNNIVSITRPAATAGGASNFGVFVANNHTFTMDNNLYFINSANANNFIATQGSNFSSLGAWSAFSGRDANSSTGNPFFAGYPNNLTPGCVVNARGANVLSFVPNDFNGASRSTLPDPGAIEIAAAGNVDAALSGIVEPNISNTICSSSPVNISVRLQNTGSDTLRSATINWSVNNVAQTPANWTGSLLPGQSAIVSVGSWNFAAQTQNNVVIFSSSPNGTTDACSLNDSLRFSKGAGLNGTYTINPIGGNFASFNEAVSFMQLNGICGPVTFNVAPAVYTGRVVMTPIPGSSNVNTVTFNGTSVNDVIIEEPFSGTVTDYSVVQFNGVDNVIFRNITVRSAVPNFCFGFLIRNASDNNIIENCVVDMRNSTSLTTANIGIVFSNSATSYASQGDHANGTIVRNNRIIGSSTGGGYLGISYYGSTTSTQNLNNIIENNEVQDFYNYGIYLYGNCNNLIVRNNSISRPNRTTNTTLYGIYTAQGIGRRIIGNRIFDMFNASSTSTSTFYGIYQASETNSTVPNQISNNAIYRNNGAGVLYGIFNTSAYYTSYSHNNIIFDSAANHTSTIYGFYSSGSTNSAYQLDFKNNIVIVRRPGGTRYGLYLNGTTYFCNSNNNLVTVAGAGSTNYFGYHGAVVADIATWQTTRSKDLNSVTGIDPLFTSSDDFTPTNPAINNLGTPALYVPLTTDMNGKTRSTTLPDIGCIEWTPICVGSNLIAGSPYQGTMRSGTAGDFDHLKAGTTIALEMVPPTAFGNSGFGTTWTLDNFFFNTVNNTAPAAGDTSTSLPGASNGRLTFTPSANYTDSMFVLNFVVRAISAANECESRFTRYIFVAPVPVADFDSSAVACFGQGTTIDNLSTISTGSLGYDWNFGDTGNPTGSQATDPTHQFSAPGLFNVTLTATSNLGYSSSVSKQVRVSHLPTVAFTNSTTCDGDSVRFINNTTLQGPAQSISYDWDLDNNDQSTLVNPTKKYSTHGNYTVKLTATTALGCKATQTRNIVVFPLPVADFSSSNLCKGETTNFTNTSTLSFGNLGSSWQFGDGNTSTASNPTNTFSNIGTYNVKLVAYSSFGCKDSVTKQVVINPQPAADFTVGANCANTDVEFNNLTNGNGSSSLTYNWAFGDNSTSVDSLSLVKHQYGAHGTYTVVLNVTNGFCSDSKTVQVTVKEAPVADFVTPAASCQGNVLSFNNQSSISSGSMTYNWNFASQGSSIVRNPDFTFTGSGSYPVTLTVTANGCTDVTVKNVTVFPEPDARFSAVVTPLVNQRQVNFTPANTNYINYEWNFGDGNTSQQVSPIYSYLSNGPFMATLRVTDANGCFNDSSVSLSFNVSAAQVMSKSFSFDVYPNPFRSNATIAYTLSKGGNIEVKLFDMTGKQVAVLHQGEENVGSYELNFSATDYNLSSGTYFVRLSLNGEVQTKQIVQVK